MSVSERRCELLALRQTVLGCDPSEILRLDQYDRYATQDLWYNWVPKWIYNFFASETEIHANGAIIDKMKRLFGDNLLHRVIPKAEANSSYQPLRVREVRQLFVAMGNAS